jgi:hypothetical protein
VKATPRGRRKTRQCPATHKATHSLPTSSMSATMAFFISLLPFAPLIVPSPLIALSSGTFRGLTANGTDHWLGVPYAHPPLGPLRFEAPVAISRPVGGIQDALKFSHACPQPPEHTTAPISEDCLYLNVCLRSPTCFCAIISCMHRCGGHHKLRPLRSFLSSFGSMCERIEP